MQKSTKFVDVAYLQSNAENNGAMFQVASNFNGVEAVKEASWPDEAEFLTNYVDDNTQGPAASVSAGPAAISRVLLPFYKEGDSVPAAEWRQTREQQVEMLGDVKEYYSVVNGYVVQQGSERVPEDPEAVVSRVRVCVQVGAQVTFGCTNQWEQTLETVPAPATPANTQRVSQVFCAAMNLRQGASGYVNAALPESPRLAALLLEAAYRGTYLAALRHGCPKLFLTLIGGGAFGNNIDTILETIGRVHLEVACKEKNATLKEVHVVLFNEPSGMIRLLQGLREKGVEVEIHAFRNGTGTIYTKF